MRKESHLRAVLKPPEESECSGLAGPHHRCEVGLLSPDGHYGS